MKSKKECPFCNAKRKFTHTYFSDVAEQPCNAWIDYAQDSDGKFLWYAILSGDQYTTGHTLVILGSHRRKITDSSLTESELGSLAVGLKKVTMRLKDRLKVNTVHVLSLCEGIEHLHFHLIPRYDYDDKEKRCYSDHYWDRDKTWKSKEDIANAVVKGEIHGMWYAAYHEMEFITSEFWKLPVMDRVKELEKIANLLRDPNLQSPQGESIC